MRSVDGRYPQKAQTNGNPFQFAFKRPRHRGGLQQLFFEVQRDDSDALLGSLAGQERESLCPTLRAAQASWISLITWMRLRIGLIWSKTRTLRLALKRSNLCRLVMRFSRFFTHRGWEVTILLSARPSDPRALGLTGSAAVCYRHAGCVGPGDPTDARGGMRG
ncbi:hypothetical protein [Candidatus Methylacidithermus pantelleriae]|nr:hypothetical protein [Candidatus Methylacidithermus pantelleriae]